MSKLGPGEDKDLVFIYMACQGPSWGWNRAGTRVQCLDAHSQQGLTLRACKRPGTSLASLSAQSRLERWAPAHQEGEIMPGLEGSDEGDLGGVFLYCYLQEEMHS